MALCTVSRHHKPALSLVIIKISRHNSALSLIIINICTLHCKEYTVQHSSSEMYCFFIELWYRNSTSRKNDSSCYYSSGDTHDAEQKTGDEIWEVINMDRQLLIVRLIILCTKRYHNIKKQHPFKSIYLFVN